jgi:REP element-mobilizing transposase RayT
MPQSLVKNYLHITFSTKERKPLIKKDIHDKLFSYIAGICNQLDCHAIQIGGVEDHIHILCLLSKNRTLVSLLKEIKSTSSKWIKTKGEIYQNFYWQTGYAAFSVNPSEIKIVRAYIQNQEEHHKKKTYKEELEAFLIKYDVDFDEKYLWD